MGPSGFFRCLMNAYQSPTIPADPSVKSNVSLLYLGLVIIAFGFAGGYSLGYLHGFMYSRYWDGPPVQRIKSPTVNRTMTSSQTDLVH